MSSEEVPTRALLGCAEDDIHMAVSLSQCQDKCGTGTGMADGTERFGRLRWILLDLWPQSGGEGGGQRKGQLLVLRLELLGEAGGL